MNKKNNFAIVLAAGIGSRMNSDLPKCAISVKNVPMIKRIVKSLKDVGIKRIIVVVGYKKEIIKQILKDEVEYAYQEKQLGTADACKSARNLLVNLEGQTIIIPGDMALIKPETILELIKYHNENDNQMTILSSIFENPTGFGRIVRNENNQVLKIVEELDASEKIKKIKEVNTGVYVVDNKLLFTALDQISNDNVKNEYYLTDIVTILTKNYKVESLITEYDYHLIGINDLKTLRKIEYLMEIE